MSSFVPVEFPLSADLIYLRTALPQLEEYLTSSLTAWPVGVPQSAKREVFPLLSPGTLLLACARICLKRDPNQDAAERQAMLQKRQEICEKWKSAWQKKIQQDYQSYAFLWENLLNDYRFDPDQAAYYPFEIHQRVALELLIQEAPDVLAEEKPALDILDIPLQEIFSPGDFIWESSLSPCFPASSYWYLYRKIAQDSP